MWVLRGRGFQMEEIRHIRVLRHGLKGPCPGMARRPVWLELREGGRKKVVGDRVRELKQG